MLLPSAFRRFATVPASLSITSEPSYGAAYDGSNTLKEAALGDPVRGIASAVQKRGLSLTEAEYRQR